MEIEKNKINHLTFLSGFHIHKPDFNFTEVSGKLLNQISEILEFEFEKIPVADNFFILKKSDDPLFEIRFQEKSLVYEDAVTDFIEFKKKSFAILDAWQSISDRAKKLRIAGTRRRFLLEIEKPKSKYHSFIFDNYFKNLEFGGKKSKISIHSNFWENYKGDEYNMNIYFDEYLEKKYLLEMKIDINRIDYENIGLLSKEKINDIFDYSEFYFENIFFKNIKIELK